MTAGAWLVAYLEPNGTYRLSIVSEPNPTVIGGMTGQVMSARGHDFASAEKDLVKMIRAHLPESLAKFGDSEVRAAKWGAPRQKRR